MYTAVCGIETARGFSLTELLIAMTLSLILLAGTMVVFSSGRESYTNIDQLSRVQENGRFALDQIVGDLRAAGYTGCAKSTTLPINTLNSATALAWAFATPLSGFNSASATSWSPALDASLTNAAPTGPTSGRGDVLVIRAPKPGAAAVRLNASMTNSNDGFSVLDTSPAPVALNDVAMISNCEGRAFFEVSGYAAGAGVATISHGANGATTYAPGNVSGDVGLVFGIDSEVIPVVTNAYFLAPSTAGTSTSLWRKPSGGPVEEVVEGIDSLQVLYGVDTDKDQQVDNYVPAQSVADWNAVISVRVALLVESVDEYGANQDKRIYAMLDTAAGPFNDRRVRQMFTATVTLRNATF